MVSTHPCWIPPEQHLKALQSRVRVVLENSLTGDTDFLGIPEDCIEFGAKPGSGKPGFPEITADPNRVENDRQGADKGGKGRLVENH